MTAPANRALRLDIPYPKRCFRDADPITPEQLTVNIIMSAVNLVYSAQRNHQMSVGKLRMLSRIKNVIMDDDGKAVSGEIELSPEQFDFINSTITEAEYPPEFADAVTALADYLETIKLKKKDE